MKKTLLAFLLLIFVLQSASFALAQGAVELQIPASMEIISQGAFYGDDTIESVVVPEGTKEIHARAFANSGLKKIILPSTLTYIADDAFAGCENLEIDAPENSYAWQWWKDYNQFMEVNLVCSAETAYAGNTVTWTAVANRDAGSCKYSFEFYRGNTRISARMFSRTNTFSYTFDETGDYYLVVAARSDSGEICTAQSDVLPVRMDYSDPKNYDGRNLLVPLAQGRTHNGIVFTADNGIYTANGTATSTAFLQLDGATNKVPEWAKKLSGETIQVQYRTDSQLRLIIRAYTKAKPEGFIVLDTRKNTSFVMPDVSAFTGMWVRLQVPSGYTLDNVVVQPVLSWNSTARNPAMLTIIDDDGAIKYYEQLYPLAKSRGVSIATAIATIRVEGGLEKWMTWDHIRECSENGMEVLCHSYSHSNHEEMDGFSEEDIIRGFRVAKEKMQVNGVYSTDMVVYPSSSGDLPTVQNAAQQIFSGGVLVGYNSTNFRNSNPYALNRYRIDYDYHYDADEMRGLIDELKANGGWMIWMIHTSGNDWNENSLNAIADSIDYAKAIGVPIVTAGQGMQTYFGR